MIHRSISWCACSAGLCVHGVCAPSQTQALPAALQADAAGQLSKVEACSMLLVVQQPRSAQLRLAAALADSGALEQMHREAGQLLRVASSAGRHEARLRQAVSDECPRKHRTHVAVQRSADRSVMQRL